MSLTPDRVHIARTAGLTDSHLARLWRVTDATVRQARRGETYRSHPTPADVAPRDSTGCTLAIRAGQPQKAVPRKQRRVWTWE
jgi:hypothetical protein